MNAEQVRKKTERLAGKEFCEKLGPFKNKGVLKRNYTHHAETLHVFTASTEKTITGGNGWQSRWVSKKGFEDYPFSSAHARIAGLIR